MIRCMRGPLGNLDCILRFFDYANFRLPLSTFLVDVLRHFRINISQLSVTGEAKSGLVSFSKRSDNAPHVTRDPALVAADFNAQDYATFVAHPSPFRKFPEAFLCLDEPRLLDTTIGRTVPLLLIAPDRAESELEASVERIFDEGGSGNQTEQGDFARGGHDANIQPVVEVADTVVEDVAHVQPRRQGKRKSVVVDAGGASDPPKKLRKDHGTLSETSVGGKSRSAIKRLLARAVLNAEVGVAAIPTLPFGTTSVSSTPEREGGDHTDSVAEPNLRTIGAPQRFIISSDSSHHSGTNIAEAEVDSLVRSSAPIMTYVTTVTLTVDPSSVSKEKPVDPSLFCIDSSSAGGTDPTTGVSLDRTGSDFLVGAIRTVIDLHTDLQKNLKAQLLLREAEAAEAIRLCVEASNFGTVEKSLQDETNALKERNAIFEKERDTLDVKVTELEVSAVSKERELTDLNAPVTSIKSRNDNLMDRVHELEISSSGLQEKVIVYQNCMKQLEKFQDDQMKVVNDKFDKLYTDFIEMALHLEEKFYPHLLTTISGRRWLLTQGMELTIIKCLNSPQYLFALGAAIGMAIEKGMQDGLSAGITRGKEDRVLTDVSAYNPSAEVDYISGLQQLQNVNFPLLAELKSNKDASIEAVMDILRLEGPLVDKLGLDQLQPNVDQLMVPIHQSPNKVVIGATALSLALDVSSVRPFSVAVLTGTEDTSDIVSATADTTTALSTTFASTSSIAPISVDDYEVIGANDQVVAHGSAASFPNVDDTELNIV
ncbi:hypothetical protein Tco_0243325 [Tanacetum coccineum]